MYADLHLVCTMIHEPLVPWSTLFPSQRTLAALAAVVTRRVDHAGAYRSLVELVDAQFGLTAPLHGRIELCSSVCVPRCAVSCTLTSTSHPIITIRTPALRGHIVFVRPPQMELGP